jgi:hypothetical protein
MTTRPPELSEADRYLLTSLRAVRQALRRSRTFEPHDAGYLDITRAWHSLTDQLFGRDIAHAYRVEEGSDDVDAVLAVAFEATAHRLASEREAYPDCVLRNAGSLRDSRPVGDRFELLAARALEIRAQGAPVRS